MASSVPPSAATLVESVSDDASPRPLVSDGFPFLFKQLATILASEDRQECILCYEFLPLQDPLRFSRGRFAAAM